MFNYNYEYENDEDSDAVPNEDYGDSIYSMFDNVTSNFNKDNIYKLLMKFGLIDEKSNAVVDSLRNFVYIHGNREEVYSKDERNTINDIKQVICYEGIPLKNKRKDIIKSNIFVIKAIDLNPIYNNMRLMHILDKAYDSFNIFVFVLPDEIYLGCRIFSKDNATMLSFPITSEEQLDYICDEFSYISIDNFEKYYKELVELIMPNIVYTKFSNKQNVLYQNYIKIIKQLNKDFAIIVPHKDILVDALLDEYTVAEDNKSGLRLHVEIEEKVKDNTNDEFADIPVDIQNNPEKLLNWMRDHKN